MAFGIEDDKIVLVGQDSRNNERAVEIDLTTRATRNLVVTSGMIRTPAVDPVGGRYALVTDELGVQIIGKDGVSSSFPRNAVDRYDSIVFSPRGDFLSYVENYSVRTWSLVDKREVGLFYVDHPIFTLAYGG